MGLGVGPAAGGIPYTGDRRSQKAGHPCRASHKGRAGRGPSLLDVLQDPVASLQRVGLLPPIAEIRCHLCNAPTTMAKNETDMGRLRCARRECRARVPWAVCLKVPGWPTVSAKLAAGIAWCFANGATAGFAGRALGTCENTAQRAFDALRERTARAAYLKNETMSFAPGSQLEID